MFLKIEKNTNSPKIRQLDEKIDNFFLNVFSSNFSNSEVGGRATVWFFSFN
jgi:hypothetical protein